MAEEGKPEATEVVFNYLKSNHFRVIHADGAWGGISPQGNARLIFYNERPPIPQITVSKLEHGALGADVPEKMVSRSGVVREMEVDVVFGLDVAIALQTWIGAVIGELKKRKPTDIPK